MAAHAPARPLVVACGHLCIDLIPSFPAAGEGREWFTPGRLSEVGAATIATGGAVSNVGLSLHRLGIPVRMVAGIGDDALGRLIADRVESHGKGLSAGLTVAPGAATSYTVVLSPPGTDRVFLHCPGANDLFGAEQVPDAALDGATIFHFGYPPLMKRVWSDGGAMLRALLDRARARGALASLDMSLPDPASPSGRSDWGAFLAAVLPSVDLFVPSAEELLYMADRPLYDSLRGRGGEDPVVRGVSFAQLDRVARRVLDAGVSAVLVKMGDRGAWLRTGPRGLPGRHGWESRQLYSPCYPVTVAGTTGAGDATIAGFLGAIASGRGPADALRMAVAVGACCVEAPDATSGIRSWDETEARLRSGWSRAGAPPSEPGWSPLGDGAWRGPGDSGPLS